MVLHDGWLMCGWYQCGVHLYHCGHLLCHVTAKFSFCRYMWGTLKMCGHSQGHSPACVQHEALQWPTVRPRHHNDSYTTQMITYTHKDKYLHVSQVHPASCPLLARLFFVCLHHNLNHSCQLWQCPSHVMAPKAQLFSALPRSLLHIWAMWNFTLDIVRCFKWD